MSTMLHDCERCGLFVACERHDQRDLDDAPARPATLRRLERGHLIHDDGEVAVRYEGSYMRLSVVQALALAGELPAGAELARRLRDNAAAALRERHGMSWERACALVAGDAR